MELDGIKIENNPRKINVLLEALHQCEELTLTINHLAERLEKAEMILEELAKGHQSRDKYNELIGLAQLYFEREDEKKKDSGK